MGKVAAVASVGLVVSLLVLFCQEWSAVGRGMGNSLQNGDRVFVEVEKSTAKILDRFPDADDPFSEGKRVKFGDKRVFAAATVLSHQGEDVWVQVEESMTTAKLGLQNLKLLLSPQGVYRKPSTLPVDAVVISMSDDDEIQGDTKDVLNSMDGDILQSIIFDTKSGLHPNLEIKVVGLIRRSVENKTSYVTREDIRKKIKSELRVNLHKRDELRTWFNDLVTRAGVRAKKRVA
ncbi:hypothetical protein AAMO2058_000625700 [Amorphochlora amoebiformis]